MKQLSVLDALFLYLETPEMPMHVGALQLLAWPPQRGRARGEAYVDALRRLVASRLDRAPMLSRRLVGLPLQFGNPFWLEGVPVDLHWHVRAYRLPPPGGAAQLNQFIARHHAQRMDRSRPLWQLAVIEGLDRTFGANVLAVYTKLHHAAVDGNAAMALSAVLFDTAADPATDQADARSVAAPPAPALSTLLAGALRNQVVQSGRLLRSVPTAVAGVAGVLRQWAEAAARGAATAPLQLVPRTFLGVNVSRTRAYATARVPLAELKELGRSCGATINDLVLWLVSTALRDYIALHQPLPQRPLLASVPVSLRAPGDTTSNTQATLTAVNLATHIADPAQRLAAIRAATAAMKDTMARMKPVLSTELPSIGLPWVLRGAAALYGGARIAERLPGLANLVVSNVPGPQFPLYLAGARMLATYPVSIVVHGVALNITVQSYDGALGFGCTACGKAAPDIARLAHGIEQAFETLRAAASRPPDPDPGPTRRARPRARTSDAQSL